MDVPDLSQEVEDLLRQMKPEETFLLFQAISSLVSPVFIWNCLCTRLPLPNVQISAYIPDYEGIIPPLFTWKDSSGDQLHIKRIFDRETLIRILDDIIISSPVSGVKEKTLSLPVDPFLCLLCLSDSFHLAWFQALENHSPVREYINYADINMNNKDPLYLLDKRWFYPAGLAACPINPNEWDDERKKQAISYLIDTGLIIMDESGEDISLSDNGVEMVSSFSPCTVKITSQESSIHADESTITSTHWIIRAREKIVMVLFREKPPNEILITTTGPDMIRSYHQKLIIPGETGRILPEFP
jgi:hypothetical protein